MPDLTGILSAIALIGVFGLSGIAIVAGREMNRKGRISRTKFIRYICLLGISSLVSGISGVVLLWQGTQTITAEDWFLRIFTCLLCVGALPLFTVGIYFYGTWMYVHPRHSEKREKAGKD